MSKDQVCVCCWLQDKYGGFKSSLLVDDFVYYADTVFSHLGRFVHKWITFNEPLVTCDLGFKAGETPVGFVFKQCKFASGCAMCVGISSTSTFSITARQHSDQVRGQCEHQPCPFVDVCLVGCVWQQRNLKVHSQQDCPASSISKGI